MIPSLLTLIDLFGRPVTIKFFGKDRFKTQFGGVCSLIFFGFLGWVLYNASADMFSRRNPITINSQIYAENPKPMTLTSNNFPMAVQLEPPVETGYNTFINESIFTVNFVYVSTKRGLDENGEVQQDVEVTRLAKEPCTLNHFGDMADSFSKIDLRTTYCIAKEQPEIQELIIQGSFSSPDDQFIVVRVDLCNNDTSEVECVTEDVQKQYLNGAWVYVYFTDMGVDPNNFTHPNSRFRATYETMVSLSTYKEGYIELSPVYVKTDAGWIMAEEKTEIYTQVYNKYEYLQIEPNSDGILLRCYVALSQTEFHYSRTYKKIQNVLAEVGGLANVAIAILMVVTTPYLNLKFRESLINELFDIHPITLHKKKSNKKKKNRQAKSIKSTTTQEKNQAKITVVGGNEPQEYFKTDFLDTSPNKKGHDQKYELQKVKEDINFDSQHQQTEKDLFCLSPKSPEFQVNSFLSNPDEKDLLSHRNSESERNQKNEDIKRNIHLGDNLLHEIKSDSKEIEHSNKDAEGHISIKIKADNNEVEMDCVKHKTGMTKVKSKKDISDDMGAIFGDDNFSDCLSEANKQELDFPLPSEQKEELEQDQQPYRVQVFTDHDNVLPKTGDLFEKTNIPSPLSQNIQKDPYQLSISPFEYASSFVYQTESLKQKMQILDEGTKRLNNKLDAVTILKKMREIDKLKAMLFDMDQALLFNNLPKPELIPKSLAKNDENNSVGSPYGLLRKFTLREQNPPTSLIRDMHNKLESKVRKSEIDQRFIAVFKEKV